MTVKWTQDLSVGYPEIDNQHIELFVRINNLLEAMTKGRGKEEIGKTIAFLEEYVVEHFGVEQRYMQKLAYPDHLDHKEQHRRFVNEFAALKNQFETEGASSVLVINIQRKVVDWLREHIGKVDKSLGAFLIAKQGG